MFLYLYWPKSGHYVSQATDNLQTALTIARNNLRNIIDSERERQIENAAINQKLIDFSNRIENFQNLTDCQQLIGDLEKLLQIRSRHAFNHSLQEMPLV